MCSFLMISNLLTSNTLSYSTEIDPLRLRINPPFLSNNYGLWIQGKVVSDLQPGLLGTWGDDHITNRPCLFTWHPFCLQFKELGNIVNQREGEDGQNVPDRTKNFKSQYYDEKETNDSLVSSPVVGDLEERMADCDVTFYRHCHHCVDRAWEKKPVVWFGWGEKKQEEIWVYRERVKMQWWNRKWKWQGSMVHGIKDWMGRK